MHAGLKSEVIPKSQFVDDQGNLNLEVGDEVKVALETVEDGFGETRLSREKAKGPNPGWSSRKLLKEVRW